MLRVPYRRNDKAALLHKQDFIRALVDNPALKNKFDQLLAEAQQYEQDIIVLMSDVFKNERCPELAGLPQVSDAPCGTGTNSSSALPRDAFRGRAGGLKSMLSYG